MQRIVLFIISLLLFVSCCESIDNVSYTNTYKSINVKSEYKVYGYTDYMRVYVFEIDDHEYIGSPYSENFIHSPNCKCREKFYNNQPVGNSYGWSY